MIALVFTRPRMVFLLLSCASTIHYAEATAHGDWAQSVVGVVTTDAPGVSELEESQKSSLSASVVVVGHGLL